MLVLTNQIDAIQSDLILRVHGWPPNQDGAEDNFLCSLKPPQPLRIVQLLAISLDERKIVWGNRWLIAHTLSSESTAHQNCCLDIFHLFSGKNHNPETWNHIFLIPLQQAEHPHGNNVACATHKQAKLLLAFGFSNSAQRLWKYVKTRWWWVWRKMSWRRNSGPKFLLFDTCPPVKARPNIQSETGQGDLKPEPVSTKKSAPHLPGQCQSQYWSLQSRWYYKLFVNI